MIDLEGGLRADGAQLPDAWVSGCSDSYTLVEFGGGAYASLDLELTPLGAYAVLGQPLSELGGGVVALEDLFGPAGRRLAELLREPGPAGRRLAERPREPAEWDRRFDLVEAFLLQRAARGPLPTPAVAWAWERLWASAGRVGVGQLAAEIGCSRRYLHAKFREQVGLAPKTAARLIRFQRVCRRLAREPARWVEIAYEAGYSDQSHLNRDFRDLAGTTPTDFLARQIPGGGVVGDEIPFVHDRRGLEV